MWTSTEANILLGIKTDYTMDKIIGAALVYFLGKLNLTSILAVVQWHVQILYNGQL